MWYLYIVRCRDGSLYTGVTINIENRLKKHNSGRGGAYTGSRFPVVLEYKEACASKSEALKRELQIKNWSKTKKEAMLKGDIDKLSRLSHAHGKRVGG